MPKTKASGKIQPGFDCLVIIEGEGEIAAVPILVNKLRDLDQKRHLKVAVWPRRRPMGKDQILGKTSVTQFRQGGPPLPPPPLEGLIAEGWAKAGGKVPVIVLLDADGDRNSAKYQTIINRLGGEVPQLATKHGVKMDLIIAVQEYESWLLAVVNSLAGKHGLNANVTYSGNTESGPPDPKTWLGAHMSVKYNEKVHMLKFTAAANWSTAGCKSATPRNRSLAELYNVVKTYA